MDIKEDEVDIARRACLLAADFADDAATGKRSMYVTAQILRILAVCMRGSAEQLRTTADDEVRRRHVDIGLTAPMN